MLAFRTQWAKTCLCQNWDHYILYWITVIWFSYIMNNKNSRNWQKFAATLDQLTSCLSPFCTRPQGPLRAPLLNQLILKCLAIPGHGDNGEKLWKQPMFRTKYHPTGGTFQANTEIWLQFAPQLLVQFSELVRQVRNKWRSFWVTTSFCFRW